MWQSLWFWLAVFHVVVASEAESQEVLQVNQSLRNLSSYDVLNYTNVATGQPVKPGTKLRILCVGDSITSGALSGQDGGDGDGYRRQLRNDLSKDEVVFAGTVSTGTMTDGYFAAWPGKTVQFISDNVTPSLEQRPNIILLHAGTNDMDEGAPESNDPADVAERLGKLIDKMIKTCPDAVILVAVIVGTCAGPKEARTPEYQALIPGVVQKRQQAGHHVLAVDFSTFPLEDLRDCVHPSNEGYRKFGDYWYDFVTQIPSSWIKEPVGNDPERSEDNAAERTIKMSSTWLLYIGLLCTVCWHARNVIA